MKLLIASQNLHKIAEFKAILKRVLSKVDVFSLKDFPTYVPPQETGKTFEENASMKALHAATHLEIHALADDSGLVVPALGGEPGIFSHRYAGENATDKENRDLLVNKLKELKEEDRTGYFACSLAFAKPNQILKTSFAQIEGFLLTETKGGSGFGYDPLFMKFDYRKTFAELEAETKNRISHRRKALDKLLTCIEGELSTLS